ncbi:MAG: hypothetical protein KG029_15930 [Bacteroidetes bacterium]|nr:hypothetical protein [Bacteroidota bacterium]
MKFPIFQISVEQWKKLHEFELEYSDKITVIGYNKAQDFFLDSEYIDCNGDVYRVTGFEMLGMLSRIFRFIPFIPLRVKLILTKQNKKLSLEQFRTLMLKRVNQVSQNNDLATQIKNAKTYAEIMGEKS